MRPQIPTSVRASDFQLFSVGDNPATLSGVAREWLDAGRVQSKTEEFIASAKIEFARELFSNATVVGVLQCNTTTPCESDTEWLLLANNSRIHSTEIFLSQVVSSEDGEFLFLPISRFVELDDAKLKSVDLPLAITERFFVFFGKLRISMPHLGGTSFRSFPTPCPPEMIASKGALKQWNGASIFYVIDHCDYLVLGKQGQVGFIPIEPDQPIQPYASDFDSFLGRWLSELLGPK